MKNSTLQELYINELQDIYSAETQILKALPKVIDATDSDELKQALSDHFNQTQGHVERLDRLFEMLGEKSDKNECEAMKGILKEGDEVVKEFSQGPVRDAALIAACQRVEHYEIAAYGSVRAFAETLGLDDHIELLTATLDEESDADEKLTSVASDTVNPSAMEQMSGASR